MKILVFGAGVLGTLYAAHLQEAGHDVTILARGRRLAQIRRRGLLLEASASGRRLATHVPAAETLRPDDAFDLVVVLVRKEQVASVLPPLAANQHTPNVLFMSNNAKGPGELVAALGRERVLLGFPGAGGTRQGAVVRYNILPGWFQPTTLGEVGGATTPRLRAIAGALRAAGFPVAISPRIDAWLKTHVALVSPVANAVYSAGGDIHRLAQTRDGLVLLVRAAREGLQALQALDIPITPAHYRLLLYLPEPLLVLLLQRVLDTAYAELVIAQHANTARGEMQHLATEFRSLMAAAAVPARAWDELAHYLDPDTPPLPEGSAQLPLRWGRTAAAFGLLSALFLLAYRITAGRSSSRTICAHHCRHLARTGGNTD